MALATLESLIESLEDALDYEETGSTTKAQTVITVTSKLLARRPSSSARSSSSISYDMAQLRSIQTDARTYIKSQSSTRVRFLGVNRHYRG